MFQSIYEIPIYRLSIDKRREETEDQKQKYFQYLDERDESNYRSREDILGTYSGKIELKKE